MPQLTSTRIKQREEEDFILEKIKEGDGLLGVQLYQMLKPDSNGYKISETTFRERLKNAIRGEKIWARNAQAQSSALFYSARHDLSADRLALAIMMAEYDLINGKPNPWFLKESELYKVYAFLSKHTDKTNFQIQLNQGAGWHQQYTNKKQNQRAAKMVELQKKIEEKMGTTPKEKDTPVKAETDPNHFDYTPRKSYKPMAAPVVPPPKEKPRPIHYLKPDITLLSMFLRNIYIEPVINEKTKLTQSLILHWFDASNNLFDYSFQCAIAKIFDLFKCWGYCYDFEIKIYTWSDIRKNVYERYLIPSRKMLTNKYGASYYADSFEPHFMGIEFISLGIDAYFNIGSKKTAAWDVKEKAVSMETKSIKSTREILSRPKEKVKRRNNAPATKPKAEKSMKRMLAERLKELKEKKNLPIEDIILDLTSNEIMFDFSKKD